MQGFTGHYPSLLVLLLILVLGNACSSDDTQHSETNAPPPKAPILFLGSQLTIDPTVSPELLFPSLIQTQLEREAYLFRVNNAAIARESLRQLIARWPTLKSITPQLVVIELPSENRTEATYEYIQEFLELVLEDIPSQQVLLWTMPSLGQPLPLKIAEGFPVSIVELPIKNTDWDESSTLQSQIFEQLWPAIELKLKK